MVMLAIFLSAALLFLYLGRAPAQNIASPFSEKLVERQKERVSFSQTEKLAESVGLQPQMTVLDIGAGSGQFAFAFSSHMKGQGRIFATDVENEKIQYIKRQIKNNHIKNIVPVLVRAKGVDPFYTRHRYDVIFMAHTRSYLNNRVDYYRTLRNQLAGNGVFVILAYKDCKDFSPADITDPLGCDAALGSLPPSSPFHNYYSGKKTIPTKPPGSINNAQGLQARLAEILNAMLNDLSFFPSFFDAQGKIAAEISLLPEEEQFLYWGLRFLKEDRILDDFNQPDLKAPKLYPRDIFLTRTINKVLIVQQFRRFLYNGKAPYLPGANLELEMGFDKQEMKQAGFRLKAEYDFIPFEALLIFEKLNSQH